MPPHLNSTCCRNINTSQQPVPPVLRNWLSTFLPLSGNSRWCQHCTKKRQQSITKYWVSYFWQFSLFNLASYSLVISNPPNWTQLQRSWRRISLGSFLFCSSFVCDQASTWLPWKVMVIQAWTTIFGARTTDQMHGMKSLTLTLDGEGGTHH